MCVNTCTRLMAIGLVEVNALNPEIYYSNYPVCTWGFSFGMEGKHRLKEPLPLHAIGLEIINSKKKVAS